jgi:aspartate carbamoyltransferase catalytic subunit
VNPDALNLADDAPREPFAVRSLLSADDLTAGDATRILDTAEVFFDVSRSPIRKVPTLRGKTVINLFFEASTRTRTSFELAGKRLSAGRGQRFLVGSSVSKGETLLDTVKNLEAMQPRRVRDPPRFEGAPHYVAKRSAGRDQRRGRHARAPDAGLARRVHDPPREGRDLRGPHRHDLRRHYCTAASRARTRTCSPGSAPRCAFAGRARWFPTGSSARRLWFDDSHRAARRRGRRRDDAAHPARAYGRGAVPPTRANTAEALRPQPRVLALAKPDAIVMHPGPMNRGVEIDPDVADGPQSAILDQVEAGVAVRMAVLWLLCGG